MRSAPRVPNLDRARRCLATRSNAPRGSTPRARSRTGPRTGLPAAPSLGGGRDYPRQVAQLILQVAQGAHALHEAGVVHRDIKPGNIMCAANGTHAVLVDLGVAQLAGRSGRKTHSNAAGRRDAALCEPPAGAGRREARPADRYLRTGVTLWELLTLHPFLDATDEMPEPVLMEKIQHDEPARVRSFHPQTPRDLEAIVQKCLEKRCPRAATRRPTNLPATSTGSCGAKRSSPGRWARFAAGSGVPNAGLCKRSAWPRCCCRSPCYPWHILLGRAFPHQGGILRQLHQGVGAPRGWDV